MIVAEILDFIKSSGFVCRHSWLKNYGNGTLLTEYKVYKTQRSKKPIFFVQIGHYNKSGEVIGCGVTLQDCITHKEIENMSDLQDLLAQF